MKRINLRRAVCIGLAAVLTAAALAGCGKKEETVNTESETGTETHMTYTEDDIDPDEIAVKIGDYTMDAKNLGFYYLLYKSTFESGYGITDWTVQMSNGGTYGDYLKDVVANQVNQFVYLYNFAKDNGLEVDAETLESKKAEAKETFNMLDPDSAKAFGITEDDVYTYLVNDTLASLGYNKAVADAREKLTDEELESCNYKHVQQLLVSTVVNDSDKSDEEFDADCKELAESFRQQAIAGEDFAKLAAENTDDHGVDYYINNKGEGADGMKYVDEFVQACLALKEGDVSELCKTQYGYHVIKCIEELAPEKTEEGITNLCADKVYNEFSAWLDRNPYEYYDKWNYLEIRNPETAENNEGETGAVETEASTETKAEETK